MCMNKSQPGVSYPTSTDSIVKLEQYSISSSENSRTSYDDNEIIAFGPIKVKPRKKPAPTLATGRRSKYEILTPEEEQKRNVRRARNRAAAERVRVSRLNVEQQLMDQIAALEQQEQKLSNNVQTLQHKKLHLETRLFTHEQMCSTMNSSNLSLTSNLDFTSYLPLENIPSSSFQQYDTMSNDKLTIEFESFLNSLTTEQIQENFPESLSSILIHDDLNDFLMDS
ncbi:unnamed protein product [Adineta steineri]|uniref:BZIP domain-containing protein n=1 Tax=Adineta steineri TaxID=433720 RepID=A0A815U6J1_9BILA|nr:unnamed protein product [Adineta steineri]CAF1648587.1 unnamed protein product [Adineta steineri]